MFFLPTTTCKGNKSQMSPKIIALNNGKNPQKIWLMKYVVGNMQAIEFSKNGLHVFLGYILNFQDGYFCI